MSAQRQTYGWLHRLDPRSKLALCGAGVVWVLNAQIIGLCVAVSVSVLALMSSRLSARRILTFGANMLPLLTVVLLSWPLFYSRGEETWFAWAFIRITRDGVVGGITTALRIVALVYVLAPLTATTDQARMISALRKLGLPYVWCLTMSMSLRYIPTLYALYRTVVEAQQARAWVVPRGHWLKRAQGYVPVLVAVLIGAIRLSDQTAAALTARGFNPNQPRVLYRDVQFTLHDWLVVAGAGAWLCVGLLGFVKI